MLDQRLKSTQVNDDIVTFSCNTGSAALIKNIITHKIEKLYMWLGDRKLPMLQV